MTKTTFSDIKEKKVHSTEITMNIQLKGKLQSAGAEVVIKEKKMATGYMEEYVKVPEEEKPLEEEKPKQLVEERAELAPFEVEEEFVAEEITEEVIDLKPKSTVEEEVTPEAVAVTIKPKPEEKEAPIEEVETAAVIALKPETVEEEVVSETAVFKKPTIDETPIIAAGAEATKELKKKPKPAPVITTPLQPETEATISTEAVLQFTTAKAKVDMVWKKDGKIIRESKKYHVVHKDTTHELHIRDVKPLDAGTYIVKIGLEESATKLIVKEAPKPAEIVPEVSEVLELPTKEEVVEEIQEAALVIPKKPEEVVTAEEEAVAGAFQLKKKVEDNVAEEQLLEETLTLPKEIKEVEEIKEAVVTEEIKQIVKPLEKQMEVLINTEAVLIFETVDAETKTVWKKGDRVIKESKKYHIVDQDTVHELHIKDVKKIDAGVYTVKVGPEESVTKLIVVEELPKPVVEEMSEVSEEFAMPKKEEIVEEVEEAILAIPKKVVPEKVPEEQEVAAEISLKKKIAEVVTEEQALEETITLKKEIKEAEKVTETKVTEELLKIIKPLEKEMEVLISTEAILSCETKDSEAKVVWKKDDKVLKETRKYHIVDQDTIHELHIKDVKKADAGIYTVKIDTEESATKLIVVEELTKPVEEIPEVFEEFKVPKKEEITEEVEEAKLIIPKKVEEEKIVEEQEAAAEISLKKQVAEVITEEQVLEETLTLMKGTKAVEEITETKVTEEFKIIKSLEKEMEVLIGTEAVLTCETADAETKVVWKKGDKVIKESRKYHIVDQDTTHELHIKDVKKADAGVYIVKVGTEESATKLIVVEELTKPVETLPEISEVFELPKKPEEELEEEGVSLVLKPKVPQEIKLAEEEQVAVALQIPKKADEVVTEATAEEALTIKKVEEKPETAAMEEITTKLETAIIKQLKPTTEAVINTEAVLTLKTKDSTAQVTWMKGAKVIKETKKYHIVDQNTVHELHIKDIKKLDAGTYTVKVGTEESTTKLVIVEQLSKPEEEKGPEIEETFEIPSKVPEVVEEVEEVAIFKPKPIEKKEKEELSAELQLPAKPEEIQEELFEEAVFMQKPKEITEIEEAAEKLTLKKQRPSIGQAGTTEAFEVASELLIPSKQETALEEITEEAVMQTSTHEETRIYESTTIRMMPVSSKPIEQVKEIIKEEEVCSDIILECHAHVGRYQTVEWKKDGEVIRESEKYHIEGKQTMFELHIKDVSAEDAGTYTMKVGKMETVTKLVVIEPKMFLSQEGEIFEETFTAKPIEEAGPESLQVSESLVPTAETVVAKKEKIEPKVSEVPEEEATFELKPQVTPVEEEVSEKAVFKKPKEEETYAAEEVTEEETIAMFKPRVEEVPEEMSEEAVFKKVVERKEEYAVEEVAVAEQITFKKEVIEYEHEEVFEGEDTFAIGAQEETKQMEEVSAGLTVKKQITEQIEVTETTGPSETVTIKKKPLIEKHLEEITEAYVSTETVLQCITSTDKATVTWKKDGKPVKESTKYHIVDKDTVHELHIKNVTNKDAGTYTAKVGPEESVTKLIVKEEIEAEGVLQLPKKPEKEEVAEAGLVLKKEKKPEKVEEKKEAVVEEKLTIKKEHLIVETLKEITEAEISTNVTLTCVTSKKTTDVTWKKDGKIIKETKKYHIVNKDTDHELTIKDVGPKDAGTYSVKIGAEESVTKLIVKEQMEVSEVIEFPKKPEEQLEEAGDKLVLKKVKEAEKPEEVVVEAEEAFTLKKPHEIVTEAPEEVEAAFSIKEKLEVEILEEAGAQMIVKRHKEEVEITEETVEMEEAITITKPAPEEVPAPEDVEAFGLISVKPKVEEKTSEEAEAQMLLKKIIRQPTLPQEETVEAEEALTLKKPVEEVVTLEQPEDVEAEGLIQLATKIEQVVTEEAADQLSIKKKIVTETMEQTVVESEEQLTMKKKSNIVKPLAEETETNISETCVLQCLTTKAKVDIVWKKDGKVIKETKKYHIVDKDTVHELHIKDVTEKDSGTYIIKVGPEESATKLVVIKEEKPTEEVSETGLFKPLEKPVVEEAPEEAAALTLKKKKVIEQPLQEITETTVTATVVLQCVTSKEKVDIVWKKDGKVIKDSKKYKIVNKDTVHELHIKDVTEADAGVYTIKAGTEESSTKLIIGKKEKPEDVFETAVITKPEKPTVEEVSPEEAALTIKKKKLIEQPLQETTEVTVSATVVLQCVTLKEKATIVWKKDGKVIKDSKKYKIINTDTVHELQITEVTKEDAGTYTIKIGDEESTTKLVVNEPVEAEEIFKLPQKEIETLEEEGVTAILKKVIPAEEGPQIEAAEPDESITLKQKALILEPLDAVTEAELNKDTILKTKTSSSKVLVSWTKDMKIIKESKKYHIVKKDNIHELHIKQVTKADTGVYAIKVEKEESATELKIKELIADFVSKPQPLTVFEGSVATITTEVSQLNQEVKWLKEGKPVDEKPDKFEIIHEGYMHHLVIHHVTPEDQATYTAKLGEKVCPVQVTVEELPLEFITPLPEEVIKKETEPVQLKIEVSRPPKVVEWKKGRKSLSPDAHITTSIEGTTITLTLTDTRVDDSNTYTCIVDGHSTSTELKIEGTVQQ